LDIHVAGFFGALGMAIIGAVLFLMLLRVFFRMFRG